MTIISHRISCRYDELCLFEALYPAPLARDFFMDLQGGDIISDAAYLPCSFMPPVELYPALLSC